MEWRRAVLGEAPRNYPADVCAGHASSCRGWADWQSTRSFGYCYGSRRAPSERLLQFTIQAPISVEDFWTLRCEMSEKLREKLAMLSRHQLNEVKGQSLEALRGYFTD